MSDSIFKNLFQEEVQKLVKQGILEKKYLEILISFYHQYKKAEKTSPSSPAFCEKIFKTFLKFLKTQAEHPFQFEPFHKLILEYYQFGLDFIRPLVNLERSKILGSNQLDEISFLLKKKENVIFFSNHQTETDPQAISLLLEKTHPDLAKEIIFVAGERVTTDPLAIPFSMGRNLLCIYSKRYIDHPPSQKEKKQIHNQKTMQLMSQLLKEGGKAIYVAPSGGRDRKNHKGEIELAPFDYQATEMFYLMAKKSKTPTHFFPLALLTYDLMPPPKSVQKELGETRVISYCPIFMAFGKEVDMETFSDADRLKKRKKRAEYIFNLVKQDYQKLEQFKQRSEEEN